MGLAADLVDNGRPSIPMARAAARAVKALARDTADGFGNFRFAATASCPPAIPFFPSAYHAGGPPVAETDRNRYPRRLRLLAAPPP